MRTRTKIRLGLLIFIAFLLTIAAVYLLAIPALPTGYDEIARLRQADIQAVSDSSTTSSSLSLTPVSAVALSTATAIASVPSPRLSAPETPRQRFLCCWAAITRANAYDSASATLIDANKRMMVLTNDAYLDSERGNRVLRLTPEEWAAIKAHADPLAFEQAVRQFVSSRLSSKISGAPLRMENGRSQAPRDVRQRVLEAARATPLPAAAELLRLPDGAVPAIPTERRRLESSNYNWDVSLLLTQAYLHAMLHDPAFDSAVALRRLREILEYCRLSVYPDGSSPHLHLVLRSLAHAHHYDGLTDSRKLLALAHGLRQVNDSLAQFSAPVGKQLESFRRYQAECIRESLLERYGSCLGGSGNSGNAFHFFFDGKPESLWLRANAANIRRHIDLLAVAIARGDEGTVSASRRSLQRVLTLANITWGDDDDSMGRKPLIDPPQPGNHSTEILKLALVAWIQDHGRLPGQISDLAPAYLDEPWLADRRNVWWIDVQSSSSALVHVSVSGMQYPEWLLAAARDPKAFRVEWTKWMESILKKQPNAKKVLEELKTASDAQWESTRGLVLNQKSDAAKLQVSWTALPFELTSQAPSGAQ